MKINFGEDQTAAHAQQPDTAIASHLTRRRSGGER